MEESNSWAIALMNLRGRRLSFQTGISNKKSPEPGDQSENGKFELSILRSVWQNLSTENLNSFGIKLKPGPLAKCTTDETKIDILNLIGWNLGSRKIGVKILEVFRDLPGVRLVTIVVSKPNFCELPVWVDSELDDVAARVAALTPTQLRVLLGVLDGRLNKQIAFDLGITEATVKAHMTAILRKLDVGNRTQAALAARALGIGIKH